MIKIALAGNPNVGKSTIFNALTGMRQHTGNWPGKTVSNAVGEFHYQSKDYEIYDLPGTYSLISHSEEETVARDFLCYQENDLVVVVCDSLCLERNLNLVLQILEITEKVIIVVNLMDEAKKKGVSIDLSLLEKRLGVPVVGTSARSKEGLHELLDKIDKLENIKFHPTKVRYHKHIEEGILQLEDVLKSYNMKSLNPRWISLKLIDQDEQICSDIESYLGLSLRCDSRIKVVLKNIRTKIGYIKLKDYIVSTIMKKSEEILNGVVTYSKGDYDKKTKKLDRFFTRKLTGIPFMILLLMIIFWITIVGANYPSSLLYDLLFRLENPLFQFLEFCHFPEWTINMLVGGAYRTLAWVVSVMLPPMAIFFPLFTLLEDSGYLPRIAFNLDKCFQKCKACGKQALSMCMGFGCNAVGVIGCRIIDSPRERLIAILTNSFVPCNGRFPTIIAIISMFFIGMKVSSGSSILEVIILTLVILLGILMTFLISWFLSKTILKGVPSSFTLELPPYRKPQVLKVIVRSIFDKTLHVLGRAVIVSIPAGILIWLLANINIHHISLLKHVCIFLDPFAKVIGLDGVILTAFILGFPANEIVIPIMIMAYMSLGNIVSFSNLQELKNLLITNGWTVLTAINMIIITLLHFPCSTTCLTIKKETGKWRWVLLSILLPLVCGIGLCFLTKIIYILF